MQKFLAVYSSVKWFNIASVNIRNVQTCKNFYEFIWAKPTTIAWKNNLSELR